MGAVGHDEAAVRLLEGETVPRGRTLQLGPAAGAAHVGAERFACEAQERRPRGVLRAGGPRLGRPLLLAQLEAARAYRHRPRVVAPAPLRRGREASRRGAESHFGLDRAERGLDARPVARGVPRVQRHRVDAVDREVEVGVAAVEMADSDGLVLGEPEAREQPVGDRSHPRGARVLLRGHGDEQVVGRALHHAVAFGRAFHPAGGGLNRRGRQVVRRPPRHTAAFALQLVALQVHGEPRERERVSRPRDHGFTACSMSDRSARRWTAGSVKRRRARRTTVPISDAGSK